MKRSIIIALLSLITTTIFAQDNPQYDKALADSLGADDYGMKSYVLVILKSGPVKIEDKAQRDSLFRGHMANIGRLADIGKLIVAGPLKKNEKTYVGIFIFNVSTVEEATALVNSDPAVQAKVFDAEYYPWYGSAALPQYLKYHKRIAKENP